MKVSEIRLSRLRNDAHFQFFTEFCKLVERYGAAQLSIQPQYETFVALYNDADTALKKINKSSLTADIHDADKYRDDIWRGMVEANKSALHHYDATVRKAAEKLKIVFETYGNVAIKPLDEETSALYNILKDLNEKYPSETAAVNLSGWINELQNANHHFDQLMTDRYDETTAKTDLVLKNVRTKMDETYRTIVERINAAVIFDGSAIYTDFAESLNTVVKRTADILAQRQGAAAAKRAAAATTTDNDDPDAKTKSEVVGIIGSKTEPAKK